MKLNGNDGKLLAACLAAVAVLLASGPAIRWGVERRRPHSPSAVLLAHQACEPRKAFLRDEAQRLGSTVVLETEEAQWKQIAARMQDMGASPETAAGVVAVSRTRDHGTYGNAAAYPPKLWPIDASSGYVNGHKAWLIYRAYWLPEYPKSFCGTGREDPFYLLRYEVSVVSDEAPYRCWIEPAIFRMMQVLGQDDGYLRDSELLDPDVKAQYGGAT